jgi:hypothetical protein
MEKVETVSMKKLFLIIWISIMGILVAGCFGGETETNTKPLSILINESDVPGLSLKEHYYMSIPESRSFIFGEGNESGNVPGMEKYTDALPKGTRHVGQSLYWADDSGRNVQVLLLRYDSKSKFEDIFVKTLDNYKKHNKELTDKGVEVDDPDIGDYSFYYLSRNPQSDIRTVSLYFTYKNYYAKIYVKDIKEKSLDEAIRIAKIVENRLGESV